MKCQDSLCPRSRRIGTHCPDHATDQDIKHSPDGVFRMLSGRYFVVRKGELVYANVETHVEATAILAKLAKPRRRTLAKPRKAA